MAKRKGTDSESPTIASGLSYPDSLALEIRELVEASKASVATTVNAALVLLYWQIGDRIHREILGSQRAEYGEQILSTLSTKLVPEIGRGFGQRNLARMVRFAQVFSDQHVIKALADSLGWSHFVEIIRRDDPLERDFYAEMCRIERWSVRILRQKIQGMLFQRTALSKKPQELVAQELLKLRSEDTLTPDLVFRDPYLLDFLGLADTYSEQDLEAAILRELEAFILELGAGFAFIARQYRMTVDGRDYSVDLLFYHRKLRRLIAIDLKLGEFEPAYKGQMELYLRWLAKHEQASHEDSPLGLILCAGAASEQVELLGLNESGIHVAAYLTELPPRELLRRKLHDAITSARARLDSPKLDVDEAVVDR